MALVPGAVVVAVVATVEASVPGGVVEAVGAVVKAAAPPGDDASDGCCGASRTETFNGVSSFLDESSIRKKIKFIFCHSE